MLLKMEVSMALLNPSDAPVIWQAKPRPFDIRSKPAALASELLPVCKM